MKRAWRIGLSCLGLLLLAVLGGVLFFREKTVNPIHASLDALAASKLENRWGHPEMLKIRALGAKAVPDLRRVLREKDDPAVQFLLRGKTNWPAEVAKYIRLDASKLHERRWVACQAIQTLGPAARAAAPELIALLRGGDLRELNAATMGLQAVGIDAEICDRLAVLIERNELGEHQRSFAARVMGRVKPPSERTLKILAKQLSDPSQYVQQNSAESLGDLGVRTPEIVAALKGLQTNSVEELCLMNASMALWKLEKDRAYFDAVMELLEKRLGRPLDAVPRPGDAGQGVSRSDQLFMRAGEIFREAKLEGPDRARALEAMEKWSVKSQRIFVKMLLLPTMYELGLPGEKCIQICRDGLARSEDYYRIQAARLSATISEKYEIEEFFLDHMLRDSDVNVRIHAARIHWGKHRNARVALPVLIEALDRGKHQSYWYEFNVPDALKTLGEMGAAGREAVPALEKVADDPNPEIVKLAKAALAQIKK